MHVEVADFAGRLSGAEPQGEDSAGRRPGDEIEMTDDGVAGAEGGFQIGKHGGRENSADAAAIDREDAKVPVRRPTLRNAADRDAAGGAGQDGLVVGHSDLLGVVGCSPPPAQRPSISQPS